VATLNNTAPRTNPRTEPSSGADSKASMTLAVLMQNQVICTPADSLPATSRAV
jgi:hypothetical protein